jgi:segregation and condensation protein A
MVSTPMSYEVRLQAFEGPFDLLLQLIARRQLDVTEIDLAEITGDFIAHLNAHLEDLDLETATRFLVVAATLVELKGARLLPREQREELEDLLGDARDMLYARLLEYRAFRDVARLIEGQFARHEWSRARDVAPEGWILRLVPETRLSIDAAGLAGLAAAVLSPAPEPEIGLDHIRRSHMTIRDAALEVLAALPEPGAPLPYATLVGGRDRGDRVVLFLALLELFKLGHVGLAQARSRDPLVVERREGGTDLESITEEDLDSGFDAPAPRDDRESTVELQASVR